MKSKIFTPRFLFVTFTILLAAISRLLPHPFNFTPIGAMALFGGVYLSSPNPKGRNAEGMLAKVLAPFRAGGISFLIPLFAMLISDSFLELVSGIGFHNTIIYVYASFVLITGIGIYIRHNVNATNIIVASLISSVLFFLITNFGVWQVSVPRFAGAEGGFVNGINGLLSTYLLGIPFYNHELFGSFFFNTIAGDLFWCGILFGSYYFAKAKFPVLAKV